jgi:hypothetical protein
MQSAPLQITLVRLKDSSRLLRLSEPETGLALECILNPSRPVLLQKQQLKALFESMIQGADALVAA